MEKNNTNNSESLFHLITKFLSFCFFNVANGDTIQKQAGKINKNSEEPDPNSFLGKKIAKFGSEKLRKVEEIGKIREQIHFSCEDEVFNFTPGLIILLNKNFNKGREGREIISRAFKNLDIDLKKKIDTIIILRGNLQELPNLKDFCNVKYFTYGGELIQKFDFNIFPKLEKIDLSGCKNFEIQTKKCLNLKETKLSSIYISYKMCQEIFRSKKEREMNNNRSGIVNRIINLFGC